MLADRHEFSERNREQRILFWRISLRTGHVELPRFILFAGDRQFSCAGTLSERACCLRFRTLGHRHGSETRDSAHVIYFGLDPVTRLERTGSDSEARAHGSFILLLSLFLLTITGFGGLLFCR